MYINCSLIVIYRKAVVIIWICLWWVWCWAFALWWVCRGLWPPLCCRSAMWTVWSWSPNAPLLENSPSSWASESSVSPASWSSSSWAAQCLWPPYWRSAIFVQHNAKGLQLRNGDFHPFELFYCFCPQHIPMPVLYGVFLYMGASSLRGIQVLH